MKKLTEIIKKSWKSALVGGIMTVTAAGSVLSDRLDQVKDYLNQHDFQVQENQERYFGSNNYNLPLLIEESDSNISAGLVDFFAVIDTVYNQGKKDDVEDNFGLYLVVDENTDPDSVHKAVIGEPYVGVQRVDDKELSGLEFNVVNGKMSYTLSESNNVRFELYNTAGKLLSSKDMGQINKGSYTDNLNLEGLSTGTYVAAMKTDDKRVMTKFNVMK